MTHDTCLICGAQEWQALSNPHPTQSVRTDGGIVLSPLNKMQCMVCGMACRQAFIDEDVKALYEDDYALYDLRPNAEAFMGQRYQEIVATIVHSLSPKVPQRILEVGCGDGTLLQALQHQWPQAECIGIEPSKNAVHAARNKALNVYQGLLGDIKLNNPTNFDLVVSINVIEHTPAPHRFMQELKPYMNADGALLVSCPDGRQPSAELIHIDHFYSFTPPNLHSLAAYNHLHVAAWGVFAP